MSTYELGLIGLGTMGRNLLLNMADSGFSVAGYDKNDEQVNALRNEAQQYDIHPATELNDFIAVLKKPRAILLLVPAGKIVDAVIDELLPHLKAGDMIIDGGNSHFPDTIRRQKQLAERDLHFIGMGVSGGARGARLGPSMMPGGNEDAYQRVRPLLEAVAAKVGDEPCVTYLGEGACGHYVKMVHNGIEYGMMELLAEAYALMKNSLGMTNAEIAETFASWNAGELNSFLVEITAAIFTQEDDIGDGQLIDKILDRSRSKGTGKWTSQDALDLGVPIPVIDTAVMMRYLSNLKPERVRACKMYEGPVAEWNVDRAEALESLRRASLFSFIVTYAQGLALIQTASREYDFKLDLEAVCRIWRGGCIIRSVLLEDFRAAYGRDPQLKNLLLDEKIGHRLATLQTATRNIAAQSIQLGIPAPAFTAALSYFDAYRSDRLPANLIQAQRDYFGAHSYERIDREGTFRTDWNKKKD